MLAVSERGFQAGEHATNFVGSGENGLTRIVRAVAKAESKDDLCFKFGE